MKFRYARHTNNLSTIIDFYRHVIGLQVLGHFTAHNGYDGVFLGFPQHDWHLEFTQSDQAANHKPDKEDLLVFYLDSDEHLQNIINEAKRHNIFPVRSQNPYWHEKGTELTDPDGFGVMLSVRSFD